MRIVEVISSDQCSGCLSCFAICNKSAISIYVDKRGFLMPYLDVKKCNLCGLCEKICPALTKHSSLSQIATIKPFALWAEDSRIRIMSSSGGAALLIALMWNNKGYSILGATFDKSFKYVHHIIARKDTDIISTTGSKYVQSDTSEAFRQALQNRDERFIVFGTPCQIHGLRNSIKERGLNDNFYLVDIFCHGVPSYLLWWAFLDEMSSIAGTIQHLELRNKSKGWQNYSVFGVGSEGIYSKKFVNTSFGRFYLSNYCYREACYICKYNKLSAADLRLGDFWAIEFSKDYLGTSIAVPINEKGLILIEQTHGLGFRSVPISWLLESQPRVKWKIIDKPKDNDAVMQGLIKIKPLRKLYRRHLSSKYVKIAIKRFSYALADDILPNNIKNVLRILKSRLGSIK